MCLFAIYADPKVIHENNGFEEERCWEALADVLRQDVNELKEKVANPNAALFTCSVRCRLPWQSTLINWTFQAFIFAVKAAATILQVKFQRS